MTQLPGMIFSILLLKVSSFEIYISLRLRHIMNKTHSATSLIENASVPQHGYSSAVNKERSNSERGSVGMSNTTETGIYACILLFF